MKMSKRRIKVLIDNILLTYWKYKHGVALNAVLQDSEIGEHSRIYAKTKFYRSSIGDYSYVGPSSFVADTSIGKYTSISQECYIGGASHPISWLGTSLNFYCTKPEEAGQGYPFRKKYFDAFNRTSIGNDVWIGARCIVLAGVKIGDGAVIGAGSVVTKDIHPFEVWAGNPAHKLHDRFEKDVIKEISDIKWWNLRTDEINRNMDVIDNPKEFLKRVNK